MPTKKKRTSKKTAPKKAAPKSEEPEEQESAGYSIEIEDDVPLVGSRGPSSKTAKIMEVLESMEVGQSFSVPADNPGVRSSILSAGKRLAETQPEYHFASRTVAEDGVKKYRFWRVEVEE